MSDGSLRDVMVVWSATLALIQRARVRVPVWKVGGQTAKLFVHLSYCGWSIERQTERVSERAYDEIVPRGRVIAWY